MTVGRPHTAASASRTHGETSQDVAFYQDLYRKDDKARLHRAFSLPALNAENLRAVRISTLCFVSASHACCDVGFANDRVLFSWRLR